MLPPEELPGTAAAAGQGEREGHCSRAGGKCYLTVAPVSSPSPVLLGEGEGEGSKAGINLGVEGEG